MTRQETIEAIEKLLSDAERDETAATPGPWHDNYPSVATKPGESAGWPPVPSLICSLNDEEYIQNENAADSAFITNSRTRMPRWTATIRLLVKTLRDVDCDDPRRNPFVPILRCLKGMSPQPTRSPSSRP